MIKKHAQLSEQYVEALRQNSLKITRKGYVYTSVGRVALIF